MGTCVCVYVCVSVTSEFNIFVEVIKTHDAVRPIRLMQIRQISLVSA
jgi:hypothetical protein